MISDRKIRRLPTPTPFFFVLTSFRRTKFQKLFVLLPGTSRKAEIDNPFVSPKL
jgi:hypothetical protein